MADNRNRTIAPGSIDPMIDTIYRVGGADPYGSGNYYSQSQLNNNMSGNDANAIYYATHRQDLNRTWLDSDDKLRDRANGLLKNYEDAPYFDENVPGGQALAEAYKFLNYKPNTGRQSPSPYEEVPYDAYVTGADATSIPGMNARLPIGYGSSEGIPGELIDSDYIHRLYTQYLQEMLDSAGYRLPTI